MRPTLFGTVAGSAAWTPANLPGLWLWLKASTLGLNDGDSVTTWTKAGGTGSSPTQGTAGSRPTYQTNEVNGQPVIRFDGTDDFFTMGNMSAFTAGTAFIVMRLVQATPDPANAGLWDIGSDVGNPTICPFVGDGKIYDQFGTTSRKTTADPTPSFQDWNIYSVYSAANDWANAFNGTELFSTATNTVGFSASPTLGKSGGHGAGDFYLQGDTPEVIICSGKLSAPDIATTIAYLQTEYAL